MDPKSDNYGLSTLTVPQCKDVPMFMIEIREIICLVLSVLSRSESGSKYRFGKIQSLSIRALSLYSMFDGSRQGFLGDVGGKKN